MMTRAFGIDISKWQSNAEGKGKMDFNALKKHPETIRFIAARTGISHDYVDPLFHSYWREMKRIRVARIAYHVVHFTEDAQKQMDAFFRILRFKTDWSRDRLTLCLLVDSGADRQTITDITRDCVDICHKRSGRYPILYSKPHWVNTFLDLPALPALDWWIADYLKPQAFPQYTPEHPGPPRLPQGISNYLIHQTTEKGKSIGAGSFYMNYNRWNGDAEDEARYFSARGGRTANSKATKNDRNEGLFQAICVVSTLYKRIGPSQSDRVIGSLSLGEMVTIYEEKDGWYRIHPSDSVWCEGKKNLLRPLTQRGAKITPLFKARCIVPALYKRAGPGKEHRVLGNLVRGQIVEIFEEQQGWLRIAPGTDVWVNGGAQYLQKIQ